MAIELQFLEKLVIPANYLLSTANATNTTITINDTNSNKNKVLISGGQKNCELARILVLQKLDTLFGLVTRTEIMDYEQQLLSCGRKRDNLVEIQLETNTCYYFPTAFTVNTKDYLNKFYVSGIDDDAIDTSLKRFKNIYELVKVTIVSKKVTVAPRKLEWLYQYKSTHLRKIMVDNNVNIMFPGGNQLIFNGLDQQLVDRSIRLVKILLTEFYVFSIQCLNNFENLEQFYYRISKTCFRSIETI